MNYRISQPVSKIKEDIDCLTPEQKFELFSLLAGIRNGCAECGCWSSLTIFNPNRCPHVKKLK